MDNKANSDEKIAIITINGDYNYGNRLQNYAVQKLLIDKGYSVETIINIENIVFRLLRFLYKRLCAILGNNIARRNVKLHNFTKKHIRTRYVLGKSISPQIKKDYRYFVVGSDQVWNPSLDLFNYNRFFLRFADYCQRVCLSPSIGINKIPKEYEPLFKEGLNGFRYLSCREEDGSQEINRLTSVACETVIDPTLCINAMDWRSIMDKCEVDGDYVLVFFLSEKSQFASSVIERIGLRIVDLMNDSDSYYSVSPTELLYLIDNAKLVLTDSFHITALSINLNTPFYVFDRYDTNYSANNKMSSRISSLVSMFGFMNRYIKNKSEISFDCDFSFSNQVLIQERSKANAYINKCLME